MTTVSSSAEPPVPQGPEALAALLLRRLEELGLSAETHWHAPVFTVEESRDLHREVAGVHTKNLFVKDKKGRLFLLVCAQDTVVDLKGVHRLIGAQGRVSFAGPDALLAHLGVTPGSVTAFAAMNDHAGVVTIVLDEALTGHDIINAHPLTNHATTSIARSDLLTFLEASGHRPLVVDVSRSAEASDNGSQP